jgi:hypothetical protein
MTASRSPLIKWKLTNSEQQNLNFNGLFLPFLNFSDTLQILALSDGLKGGRVEQIGVEKPV